MENPQKNKLSMYLAVLGVMDTFNSAWQALAGIAAMGTRLTDLTDDIKDASGIQGTPRDGIAKGKNRKQVAMINLTVDVAGDLHSLATARGDDELAAKSAVEVSELVGTGDAVVASRCRELHKLAVENAAGIAPFGTTDEDLTALDEAIKAYVPVATAPRQAIVLGKQVTGNIDASIKSADFLLKNELDKAMRKFKRKEPDFAKAYADARIIVELGGGGAAAQKPATPAPKSATTLDKGALQPV